MFDQERNGEARNDAYDRDDATNQVICMVNPAFDAFELLRQRHFPTSDVSDPGLRAGNRCFGECAGDPRARSAPQALILTGCYSSALGSWHLTRKD
jgi:hypothetical protein